MLRKLAFNDPPVLQCKQLQDSSLPRQDPFQAMPSFIKGKKAQLKVNISEVIPNKPDVSSLEEGGITSSEYNYQPRSPMYIASFHHQQRQMPSKPKDFNIESFQETLPRRNYV